MKAIVHGPEAADAPFAYPSPRIWGKHFAEIDNILDPSMGFLLYEGFDAFPIPLTNTSPFLKEWNAFLSDGGTITPGGLANVSSIKLLSDGDNEAVALALMSSSIRITKNSTRQVGFEIRVRTSTIADTKHGFFVGLFESLVPTATSHVADAGTLADKNFIGFHRLEGDGDKIDIVYKADGQTQQSFTDAETLVADTWVKLGFLFDGASTLRFYVDGQEYATARLGSTEIIAVTFPSDINLAPVIVLKNATASTPGEMLIDWIKFGYTRADADGFA
jgi:hypothetical protein